MPATLKPLFILTLLIWQNYLLADPLTIDDAIQKALAQSFDSQIAALNSKIAQSDEKIASHGNDVRLSFGAVVSEKRPKSESGDTSFKNQTYTAQLSKVLFDFGRQSANEDSAKYLKLAKECEEREIQEMLKYKVVRAYTTALTSLRNLKLINEQIVVTRQKLSTQKSNYQSGLRSEADVINAEAELGKNLILEIKAKTDQKAASISLATLLNSSSADISLPDHMLAGLSVQKLTGLVNSWNSFLKSEQQESLRQQILALDAQKENTYSTRWPTLQAALNAQSNAAWGDSFKNTYTGQIQLTWDVPWTGIQRDQIERLSFKKGALEVALNADQKAREDKVQLAITSFNQQVEQTEILRNQTKLLERQLYLIQKKYELGKASAIEVSTAETDLLNSKIDVVKLDASIISSVTDIAEAKSVPNVSEALKL